MKELSIANFKYGLDSRREALTQLLGTLTTCENAHINPGGEVEKRKAFYQLGVVSAFACVYYGLEFTSVGAWVFGSDLPAVTSTNPGIFGADVTLFYERLQHPSVLEGETYNATYHKMTGVKSSKIFNDKTLVAATFSDGRTFLYYDGDLVASSRNGLVMFGQTSLAELATGLAGQINELSNWTALANVDQNGASQDGTTIVKSPIGVYYTPSPTFDSTLGQLGANVVDVDNTGTQETKATASFLLTRASDGTVELIAPANSNGTGTAALTGGAVATAASDVLMAAKVVQAVNDLSYIHGYSANNNGATISVYAPIGWGSSINGFNLTVNVTGGMGTGGAGPTPTNLTATASPSPLSVVKVTNTGLNVRTTVYGVITVSATGGSGSYTYLWSDFGDLLHSDDDEPTIQVRANLFPNDFIDQVIKCVVTDTVNLTSVTVYVSVHLENQRLGGD